MPDLDPPALPPAPRCPLATPRDLHLSCLLLHVLTLERRGLTSSILVVVLALGILHRVLDPKNCIPHLHLNASTARADGCSR